MTQAEQANAFHALHAKGDPLVLFNIWDAGSANAVSEAGAKALATGSWSVAAAQGFSDGEELPLEFLCRIVERITATVHLPLSVDMEGGYATDPEDVAASMRKIVGAGAVGMNFEDQVVKGEGLHGIAEQAARIRAIRDMGEDLSVPVFINARTDLFLNAERADHAMHVDEAIERGQAYTEAGASGFFVPGLVEPNLIARICEAMTLPVNVMALPGAPSTADLAGMGVARISHGPWPYRKTMSDLTERCRVETAR